MVFLLRFPYFSSLANYDNSNHLTLGSISAQQPLRKHSTEGYCLQTIYRYTLITFFFFIGLRRVNYNKDKMENFVTGLGESKGDADILLSRLPVGTCIVMTDYSTVKEKETLLKIRY